LGNLVPHINAPTKFNQDMLEFARERRNRLQREKRAMQYIESVRPSETPQDRSNCLCQEWQTLQQATSRAQPSLGNDAL
jgi:NifU-like protein involved in Fe-S cluster formation